MRVIAATNRPLEEAIAAAPLPRGPVLPAAGLPPGRAAAARPGRRTSPCWSSTSWAARAAGARACRRPPSTRMRAYAWPGNVRELRNLIERAHILAGERAHRATSTCCWTSARPSRGGGASARGPEPGQQRPPADPRGAEAGRRQQEPGGQHAGHHPAHALFADEAAGHGRGRGLNRPRGLYPGVRSCRRRSGCGRRGVDRNGPGSM